MAAARTLAFAALRLQTRAELSLALRSRLFEASEVSARAVDLASSPPPLGDGLGLSLFRYVFKRLLGW